MSAHFSLAVLLLLAAGCVAAAQDYDFFFLVLQVSAPAVCRARACDARGQFSSVRRQLQRVRGVLVTDWFRGVSAQWPGSYCDTKQSCCYPRSGKPAADFGIHGLWPNRVDGTYPQNCNAGSAFDPSKVSMSVSQ